MKKKTIILISCFILVALSVGIWKIQSVSNRPAEPALSKKAPETNSPDIKVGPMNRAERKIISDLIRQTIRDGLAGKKIMYPDLKDYDPKWSTPKTVYTTLNIGNTLRGCQGNLDQKEPLLHAIIDSAYKAAFHDPRFPKLTQEEFDRPDFNFYISVFGDKKALRFKDEADIIRQLKPFQQGAILTYAPEGKNRKRGIFLPSVWKKNPEPKNFWAKLKKKAHIKKDFFSDQFQVQVFPTEVIRDFDFIIPQDAERIKMALTAYQKLFRKDGRIQYEIDFKKGKESDKSRLVREMGSGYGLAYAYFLSHNQDLRPLMVRFLKYVETLRIPHQKGALVSDDPQKITAGSSALALLAVLYYEKESKDTSFTALRTDLKNGLVALFEPGVGVHTSPTETNTSPYYDGETWLALVMYHIFHPEDKELATLVQTLNKTMYDKYAHKYLYNFFHWGTQAAAHYYAHTDAPLMYDYLKKQLNLYIDTTDFRPNAASCSYAEGLGEAALALRNKDLALYMKVLERLENQMDIPRLLQDIPFKQKNGVPNNVKPLLGLFLNRSHMLKTRNDSTQHCLSAMMKAQLVFKDAP